ncbi:MAG: hypothetical protein WBW53_15100 [Terriglobales bacterium]
MRPLSVLTAIVLLAAACFAQQPVPRPGPCFYGCGPYVPLISTPMISLETVSPNPVGASNATTGLIAGATNSTLSEVQGSTSSEYTEPVWYQGGSAPLTSRTVNLYPEPIGREGHAMRPSFEGPPEGMRRGPGAQGREHASWMYFSGHESTADLGSVAKGRKSDHVYTNEDIERENEKNGTVKYDDKTEKM